MKTINEKMKVCNALAPVFGSARVKVNGCGAGIFIAKIKCANIAEELDAAFKMDDALKGVRAEGIIVGWEMVRRKMTAKRKISIRDFKFDLVGYGHCKVIYTSPATGKQWNRIIDDMMIIDATKGEGEDAKRKDLEGLKRQVKSNY